jgi:molecular chaperone GrpE
VLTGERDKLRDQLMRTAADFDNFRKRTRRDLEEARQRAKDDLIRDLLPVFDNLERASQTVGGASDLGSVVEGVRMVLKLFEDTLERIGMARVPALGQRFDPAVHEAIQQKETDEHPPGTVITEVAAGYRFGERLVRPAMVVVARKPAEKPAEQKSAVNIEVKRSIRPEAQSVKSDAKDGGGGNGAASEASVPRPDADEGK